MREPGRSGSPRVGSEPPRTCPTLKAGCESRSTPTVGWGSGTCGVFRFWRAAAAVPKAATVPPLAGAELPDGLALHTTEQLEQLPNAAA